MFAKILEVSAIALIATAMAGSFVSASAEETWTAEQAEIESTCQEFDGRFTISWAYDDKGVQWGQLWICDAPEVKITCQETLCRSTDKRAS